MRARAENIRIPLFLKSFPDKKNIREQISFFYTVFLFHLYPPKVILIFRLLIGSNSSTNRVSVGGADDGEAR